MRTWASLWAALTKQDMPSVLPASWHDIGLTTASQFEDNVKQWASYEPSRMRQLENLATARAVKEKLSY